MENITIESFKKSNKENISKKQILANFTEFSYSILLETLSRVASDRIILMGGTSLHLLYQSERMSIDLDFEILLNEKNTYLNKQIITDNQIDRVQYKEFKKLVTDTIEYINEDNYLKDILYCKKIDIPNKSKQKIIKFISKLKKNQFIEIILDGMGRTFKGEKGEELIEVKPLFIFNKPNFVRTLHPYVNFYNKIHRLRKFTKETIKNKELIKEHLADLYDIYFIENTKFSDNDKEKKEIALSQIDKIFARDNNPELTIKKIKENISFMKNNKEIYNNFKEIISSQVIENSSYKNNDLSLQYIYKNSLEIALKGVSELEYSLNKNKV